MPPTASDVPTYTVNCDGRWALPLATDLAALVESQGFGTVQSVDTRKPPPARLVLQFAFEENCPDAVRLFGHPGLVCADLVASAAITFLEIVQRMRPATLWRLLRNWQHGSGSEDLTHYYSSPAELRMLNPGIETTPGIYMLQRERGQSNGPAWLAGTGCFDQFGRVIVLLDKGIAPTTHADLARFLTHETAHCVQHATFSAQDWQRWSRLYRAFSDLAPRVAHDTSSVLLAAREQASAIEDDAEPHAALEENSCHVPLGYCAVNLFELWATLSEAYLGRVGELRAPNAVCWDGAKVYEDGPERWQKALGAKSKVYLRSRRELQALGTEAAYCTQHPQSCVVATESIVGVVISHYAVADPSSALVRGLRQTAIVVGFAALLLGVLYSPRGRRSLQQISQIRYGRIRRERAQLHVFREIVGMMEKVYG